MANESIRLEVAYANPAQQMVISLSIAAGSTLVEAIEHSGILLHFPEINLQQQKTGIYGQICNLDRVAQAGDRIEIYRPLLQNPMQARRSRL